MMFARSWGDVDGTGGSSGMLTGAVDGGAEDFREAVAAEERAPTRAGIFNAIDSFFDSYLFLMAWCLWEARRRYALSAALKVRLVRMRKANLSRSNAIS